MRNSKNIAILASIAMSILPLGAISHAASENDDRTMTVFKTPWCGCCESWVDAMKEAGYKVEVNDLEDLSQIKKQAGVTTDLEACHTAVLGGERKYVLEGHVPLAAIEKLHSERPEIKGISTPGMPMGSLGMGDDENAQYTVYAFTDRSSEQPTVFFEAGKDQ